VTDRLRVAVDATPLLGHPTGVGVFCAGALAGLARRPELSVSAFAVSWRRRRSLAPRLPPGVGHHQRAMPARPLHAVWARLDRPAVERFVGAADVVHGTNFVVPPTRRAAPVLTVHDLTVVRYPELCDAPTLAFPGLIRRALRRGAWVHTPSAFVADEVVEAFGADPRRVRAVHSGTPILPPPPGDEVARGLLPAGHEVVRGLLPAGTERFVLAVGTAEPRKDLPGLVEAFDRLAPAHPELALVLAGQEGWGEPALADALGAARHRDRIVRTGWVGDATLHALLGAAAVLAYPSVYEGFGFPPLQAMAAGVPVVATRAGALPEVLGDAAEFVAVGDRAALAGALDRVLGDGELREELRTRGLARAAGYTWDRCAEGLAALYRDAAGGCR
jgi:glycosyltransferase involved in cell wall biosynthesis